MSRSSQVLFSLLMLVSAASFGEETRKIISVDVTVSQTCLISKKGLSCFGQNDRQSYSSGDMFSKPPPLDFTPIRKLVNPRLVRTSLDTVCALDDIGLVCWTVTYRKERPAPMGITNITDFTTSVLFNCAISNKEVTCWELDSSLQVKVWAPVALLNPRDIKSSSRKACVMTDRGVACWNPTRENTVHYIFKQRKPSAYAIGPSHSCGIFDGKVECEDGTFTNNPPQYPGAKLISAGINFSCALFEGKGVECWGDGANNQLKVPPLKDGIIELVSKSEHTCAVYPDDLICWGQNRMGQSTVPRSIGDAETIGLATNFGCSSTLYGPRCWGKTDPIKSFLKADTSWISALSTGENFVCGIGSNRLQCFAENESNPIIRFLPVSVTEPVDLKAAKNHACIKESWGRLRCWGGNEWGESEVPGDMGRIVNFAVGPDLTCASNEDFVRCWGMWDLEQPLRAPLRELAVGTNIVCGISESGLTCWGLKTAPSLEFPKNLKNPRQLSLGVFHGCVMTDEGPKCWGNESENKEVSGPQGVKGARMVYAQAGSTCVSSEANKLKCFGPPVISMLPEDDLF